MTDFLLKRGADPNIGDAYSMTPLHFAASRGDQEVARALLHHGADPDARDYNGDTPLIEAAYRGHEEVVRLLLARGASVNIKPRGKYLLAPAHPSTCVVDGPANPVAVAALPNHRPHYHPNARRSQPRLATRDSYCFKTSEGGAMVKHRAAADLGQGLE